MMWERGARRRHWSNRRGGERDNDRGGREEGTMEEKDGYEGVENRYERKKSNKNNLASFSSVIYKIKKHDLFFCKNTKS